VSRSLLALGLVAGALGCGNSANTAGALGNVGIGLLASGISRAGGGCFATCTGTDVFDTSTGWCEPNPCGSGCGQGNRCDLSGSLPRCVPQIEPSTTQVKTTADAPTAASSMLPQPTLSEPPPPPRDPRVPQ
jgi:hypothetical protein